LKSLWPATAWPMRAARKRRPKKTESPFCFRKRTAQWCMSPMTVKYAMPLVITIR
jgi:hypothetical protein